MVVRREGKKLRTYLHAYGHWQYNQFTSRLYTDICMFTCREEFGIDGIHLFNYLTGYSNQKDWKQFHVAPINLRQSLVKLIEREIEKHTPETPGLIFVKLNALAHDEVIPALYKAAQRAVQVKTAHSRGLLLDSGLKGISDTIEVRIILGRFLEHSRIIYFKNGGDEEFYLSSADWMTRNCTGVSN
jgi:polyphosphate kinase